MNRNSIFFKTIHIGASGFIYAYREKIGRFIKMNTKIILVLGIILSTTACTENTKEEHLDIISQYDILHKENIDDAIILFGNNSREHLLSGWYYMEPESIWANSKTSDMVFVKKKGCERNTLYLTCMPITTPAYQNQTIKILLNGNAIGQIPLSKGMQRYSMDIPQNDFQVGKNILRFEFTYCVRPSAHEPSPLSVKFRRILLDTKSRKHHPKLVKKGHAVYQYANSTLGYCEKLNPNSRLTLNYELPENLTAGIRFTQGDNSTTYHKLSDDESHVTYTIPLAKRDKIKIDFEVYGDTPEQYITWKKITVTQALSSVETDEKASEPSNDIANKIFQKNDKQDIIIYVIDALRSDHVGCYGYKRDTTPHIDSFSADGTLFTNAYANTSWTRPSAATILTGLLANRHKTMSLDSKLPENLILLSEILKASGYYTAAFITNGNLSDQFGFNQGFDTFVYLPEVMNSESLHQKSDILNKHIFSFLNEYIHAPKRKPLFLFVWSTDPHSPYTPDETVKNDFNIDRYAPINKKYRKASEFGNRILDGRYNGLTWPDQSQLDYLITLYDQEILFNDHSFGELMDQLKKEEIYDDSIIVFTSDHGEEFMEHGWFEHGSTLYDEQIKIPLIIKSSRMKKGEFGIRVQLADIYPTLLDIVSIPLPYKIDGYSLITENDFAGRPILSELAITHSILKSMILNNRKIIFNTRNNFSHLRRRDASVYELYILKKDPEETHNISSQSEVLRYYFLQKLNFEFSALSKNRLTEPEKTRISIEFKEKLKELGYAK